MDPHRLPDGGGGVKIVIEHGDMRMSVEVFVEPDVKVTQFAQLVEALPGLINGSRLLARPYRGPIYELPTVATQIRRWSDGKPVVQGEADRTTGPRPRMTLEEDEGSAPK